MARVPGTLLALRGGWLVVQTSGVRDACKQRVNACKQRASSTPVPALRAQPAQAEMAPVAAVLTRNTCALWCTPSCPSARLHRQRRRSGALRVHAAFGEDVRKFFDGLSFENWAPRSSRTWRLPPTQRKAVQTGACAGHALGPYAACAVGCAADSTATRQWRSIVGGLLGGAVWEDAGERVSADKRLLAALGTRSRPAVQGFHGPSCGPGIPWRHRVCWCRAQWGAAKEAQGNGVHRGAQQTERARLPPAAAEPLTPWRRGRGRREGGGGRGVHQQPERAHHRRVARRGRRPSGRAARRGRQHVLRRGRRRGAGQLTVGAHRGHGHGRGWRAGSAASQPPVRCAALCQYVKRPLAQRCAFA